jgi:hypothetical protein
MWSSFVKQSAPSTFFKKPNEAASSGTAYIVSECGEFASLSFFWVMKQKGCGDICLLATCQPGKPKARRVGNKTRLKVVNLEKSYGSHHLSS